MIKRSCRLNLKHRSTLFLFILYAHEDKLLMCQPGRACMCLSCMYIVYNLFFFVIGSTQQAQYKTRCAESWLHYASDVADDRGFLLFVTPLLYSHFSEIQ